MSHIRMCDNCGNIFSVNEQGWTEYTRQSRTSNSYNHGAETLHMGPCCAVVDSTKVKPHIREIES